MWEGWHAHLAGDDGRLRQAGRRSPTRASRRWASPTPARCGAPATTWSPTPSPPRPTGCGSQVEPFYKNLHCYVRGRLNAKYGDAVQPKTGPIRADLLGNMWAQQWGNIYDVVAPQGRRLRATTWTSCWSTSGYDADEDGEDRRGLLHLAGPARRCRRPSGSARMITRPRDREVVCHASAWDLDDSDDIRIKMCTKVNGEDFYTVHHELGPQLLPARLQGPAVPVQERGQRRLPRGDRRLRRPVGADARPT